MLLTEQNIGDLISRREWEPNQSVTLLEVGIKAVLVKDAGGKGHVFENDGEWCIVQGKGDGNYHEKLRF